MINNKKIVYDPDQLVVHRNPDGSERQVPQGALIGSKVTIGENVGLGIDTSLGAESIIGDEAVIGPAVGVGENEVIPPGMVIRKVGMRAVVSMRPEKIPDYWDIVPRASHRR